MPGRSEKNEHTDNRRTSKKRMPFCLWLFYLGLLCLSLTGVTFSRYFTTVTGTISVQVADSFIVTFLDADETTVLLETRVYDGQLITNAPDMSGSVPILYSDNLGMDVGEHIYSDEDTVYRVFEGWKLDGEDNSIIDLNTFRVIQDTTLIAVYEILPDPPATASPSNATPSDATAQDAAIQEATPSNAEPAEAADSYSEPQLASPSNIT